MLDPLLSPIMDAAVPLTQPAPGKAAAACSRKEFDKWTLANARANFQRTSPRCMRIEDLVQYTHRGARDRLSRRRHSTHPMYRSKRERKGGKAASRGYTKAGEFHSQYQTGVNKDVYGTKTGTPSEHHQVDTTIR